MSIALRKTLILVGLGGLVVAATAVYTVRALRPRTYEVKSATLTRLDFEQRAGQVVAAVGEITFVHPKSGRTMSVAGRIGPDCPIYVGDSAVQLTDLRVGDTVAVRGTVHWDRSLTPAWVRVTRPTTTSRPTSES